MRKRSDPHTFIGSLSKRKSDLEEKVACLPEGPERDEIQASILQIETAIHMDGWLRSNLRKPE